MEAWGPWTRWTPLLLNTARFCSARETTWRRHHWCRLVSAAIALTKGPRQGRLPPLGRAASVAGAGPCPSVPGEAEEVGVGLRATQFRRGCSGSWSPGCLCLVCAPAGRLRSPRPAGPFRGRVSYRDLTADRGVTRLRVWGPGIPQVRSPKEALAPPKDGPGGSAAGVSPATDPALGTPPHSQPGPVAGVDPTRSLPGIPCPLGGSAGN